MAATPESGGERAVLGQLARPHAAQANRLGRALGWAKTSKFPFLFFYFVFQSFFKRDFKFIWR